MSQPPSTLDSLGPRGRRLWASMCEVVAGERDLVLLEESCRIADRLDRLDALLGGDVDVWMRLDHRPDGTTEVVVDSALTEARQQALALRQLLAAVSVKESGDGDADSWLDGLSSAVRDA